jgi:hypothetical protein
VPTTPSPRIVAGAAIIAAVVVAVAAIGTFGPGEAPSPSPSHPAGSGSLESAAAASPRVVIDAAECALAKAPTPDDPSLPPFGEGAFDPVDISPAWLRICLAGPAARSAEIAAFCVWNDGRSQVTDVEAVPARGDPLSASIDPAGGAMFLHVAGRNEGTNYASSRDPVLVDVAATAPATGAARFDLLEERPPDREASTAPGSATGTIRWDCGTAPPPRPGVSAGQVRLHLDAPIGQDVAFDVTCGWIARPTGPEVISMTSTRLVHVGAIDLSIDLEPVVSRPDASQLGVGVSDGTNETDYRPATSAIVAAFGPGGSTGTLRVVELTADGDVPPAPGAGIDGVDATAAWTCDPPAIEGPRQPADDRGDTPTRGIATLSFDPAVAPPITGPVICYLNVGDPQSVVVGEMSGSIDVGGGARVTLSDSGGDVLVGLIGADGSPAGEYRGQASQIADDALRPIRLEVGELTWSPKDPRYVPIGGAGGPRTLSLTIVATCDIASARLPGVSIGSMEVHLASGIERSWSVPAVCHWRTAAGGAQVTSAANLGPIDLDGQGLIVQAVPDLFVIVAGFGTSYGSSPRSTIQGDLAADGSSGNRTFTSFEPRRRITNVNGRIGGRGGVLAVDGSVRWDCGPPPAVIPPG